MDTIVSPASAKAEAPAALSEYLAAPPSPRPGRGRRLVAALQRIAPGALSGLLLTLAYAPLAWWWLAWVALTPIYVALAPLPPSSQEGTGKGGGSSAVALGYTFGFLLFLIGAYWMLEIGSVPWIMLSLIQAAPFAVLAALCAALLPRLPSGARPWVFAGLWTLSEAVRSSGSYAFPWFLLATTQVRCPAMLQIVSVTGQWGLTFAIAASGGLFGEAWLAWRKAASAGGPERRRILPALLPGSVALAIPLLLFLGGSIAQSRTLAEDSRLPARIIGVAQGAFDKADYSDPEVRARVLAGYQELTRDAVRQGGGDSPGPGGSGPRGIALVAWPETVAPGVYSEDPALRAALSRTAREEGTPLLAGVFDIDADGNWWNSAALYGQNGMFEERYDKQQIVPIGEFFPLRGILGPIYAQYGVPPKDMSTGRRPGVLYVRGKGLPLRIGNIICYESVFPRWVREEARRGAQVIVLITSDETFGTTAGPIQHADIAALRAVEARRWLVRAAATGVSEFIDPTGQVRASLPLMRRGALTYPVKVRDDTSFYVRWGDWLLWVCGGVVAAGVIGARQRGRMARESASAAA